MNAVDATSREEGNDSGVPPSLLTIILDTNPHAWSLLSSTLPLTKAIANILVFINAHLAISNANRVAVIAAHTGRAQFLYPTPTLPSESPTRAHQNGASIHAQDTEMSDFANPSSIADANKYRPFATIEAAITSNLLSLLSTTTPASLRSTTSTALSGALTLALTYISKQIQTAPLSSTVTSSADPNAPAGAFNFSSAADPSATGVAGLQCRILVVSVSGDLALQYIPIMNSIFACQRMAVPIDILTLNRDSEPEFLQQAADATGGVYMDLGGGRSGKSKTQENGSNAGSEAAHGSANGRVEGNAGGSRIAGLLQTLMMAYLPDQSARHHLVPGGESEAVDFRAACFCHGRVVDLGWVCSICLSIFCHPLTDGTCLTCGTHLSLSNYGTKPVVVPQKKKAKKKRLGNIGAATAAAVASGATSNSVSAVGTPE